MNTHQNIEDTSFAHPADKFIGSVPSFPGKMNGKRYVQLNFLYIQGARIMGIDYAAINALLKRMSAYNVAKFGVGFLFDFSD
jgi:hypothetical protein